MSRLSDVLDTQTVVAKNVPDCVDYETDFPTPGSAKELNPSPSNVVARTPFPNRMRRPSRNLMGFINETATRKKPLKNKENAVRKGSGVHEKSPSKNKRSSQKEKKGSRLDVTAVASVAETNHATTNKKSAQENHRPVAVVNERHETISSQLAKSSIIEMESVLNRLKTSQETVKNEILAVLSKLEEKINANNNSYTAVMTTGVLEQKGSISLGENAKRSQNRMSNVEIDNDQCRREQQHVVAEDVTEKHLEDRTDVKYLREEPQPRPIIVNITFTGNDKNNDNANDYTCKHDRCVCVSATNEKTNARDENSPCNDAEKLNGDRQIDCLKTKSHSERTIQFSHFSKTHKNIDEDKVDTFTKTNGEQNRVSVSSSSLKCSNRFSNGSLNEAKQSKETKREEHICKFLKSQPTPEWIRRNRESTSTDNQCETTTKTQKELSSFTTKNSNLFSVEKIVNRDKNEIVYEITQESRTLGIQRNRNINGSCPHNFNDLKYN